MKNNKKQDNNNYQSLNDETIFPKENGTLNYINQQIKQLKKIYKKNIKTQVQDNKNSLEINKNLSKQNKEFATKNSSEIIFNNIENHIKTLLTENTKLKNDKLTALAELENNIRINRNERQDLLKYASYKFASELIPVLDNFNRALSMQNKSEDTQKFLDGFKMIMNHIQLVFKKEGILEIQTKIGDVFNSEIHNAVELKEVEKAKTGTIAEVLLKGYYLHDRILRPTSVIVVK